MHGYRFGVHTRVHSRCDARQLLVIPYLGSVHPENVTMMTKHGNLRLGIMSIKATTMMMTMVVVVNINFSLLVESDRVLIIYAGVCVAMDEKGEFIL